MRSIQGAFQRLARSIFKSGSITYYYSSLFFPRDVRADVATLYAFVRTADDFVDAIPQQTKAFQTFRKESEAALNGTPSSNPIISEFVRVVQKYDIQPAYISSFFDSMEADTRKSTYKTFAELEQYIYGSADVIGLMMAQIMKLPPESHKAAQLQGKAMQLINFIRDIAEDIQLNRQYIPVEDAKRFKLRSYPPQLPRDKEQFEALVRFEIARYREIQKEAEAGYHYLPRQYRIPVKTAADMYNWTAEIIEKDPTVVFERKVKPKPALVIFYALKNFLFV